jgi:hypothetical protein
MTAGDMPDMYIFTGLINLHLDIMTVMDMPV